MVTFCGRLSQREQTHAQPIKQLNISRYTVVLKSTYKRSQLGQYARYCCIWIIIFLWLFKRMSCFINQPSSKGAEHVELFTWVNRQSKVMPILKGKRKKGLHLPRLKNCVLLANRTSLYYYNLLWPPNCFLEERHYWVVFHRQAISLIDVLFSLQFFQKVVPQLLRPSTV